MLVKILYTIFYSLIFSIGMNIFIEPANILSSGMAGIAQIINHLTPVLSFSLVYLLLNIPGTIISWRYLGKNFTILTLISIGTVTIATTIIPTVTVSNDIMLNCLFGGLLLGVGAGGLLKHHASNGGIDIYGMLLFQKLGINFAKASLVIDVFICMSAAMFFGLEVALYTILAIAVRIATLNVVYRNHTRLTVWIIGDDLSKVENYIQNNLKRGSTVFNEAVGGYSKKPKQVIMVTLDQVEYNDLVHNIDHLNKEVFITSSTTTSLYGNYHINRKVD